MTLREIYVADLNQLFQATRQKLLEWPVLAARAQNPMLREQFDEHYAQSRTHLATLESVFERLDERPRHARPDALNGVLDWWRSRHRDPAVGDVCELSLVSAAIAADYHTLAIYAEALTAARSIGDVEGAAVLQAVRDAERDRTQRLALFHEQLILRLSAGRGEETSGAGPHWSPSASVIPGAASNAAPAFQSASAREGEPMPR